MRAERQQFLELSSELTGYPPIDLEGTGLVDDYLALLGQELGAPMVTRLLDASRDVLAHRAGAPREEAMRLQILCSPVLWPVVSGLIQLWYLGSWTSLSAQWYSLAGTAIPSGVSPGKSRVPSAEAYVQQLAYRGAGAHPPGANPTGHGSWAIPPLFGDVSPAARIQRTGRNP